MGQYLASLFVFEERFDRLDTAKDLGTHLTIWASALVLIFGFLINSFYDLESDTINRPKQTAFERLVRQSTSLRIAIISLLIGLGLAYTVSYKALLYYGIYAALLWFYSHKLRKIPMLGHVSASFIGLMPFFGISVYHQYFSWHTIAFGGLVGLALFARELLKDLLMVTGDAIIGKTTMASEFGEDQTRLALIITSGIAWIPAFFTQAWFNTYAQVGMLSMLVLLSVANTLTLGAKGNRTLRWAHLCYKVVLVIGVLTIPFL